MGLPFLTLTNVPISYLAITHAFRLVAFCLATSYKTAKFYLGCIKSNPKVILFLQSLLYAAEKKLKNEEAFPCLPNGKRPLQFFDRLVEEGLHRHLLPCQYGAELRQGRKP